MDSAGLEAFPLFAGLTDDERAQIASALRDDTAEPGTMLAVQGDNAYQLFIIDSGTADVTQDGEVIRTLGPGDVFGEIGLLATGTRTASVVATSPMRLRAIFIRQFKDLEREMPQLASSMRQAMSERPGWR